MKNEQISSPRDYGFNHASRRLNNFLCEYKPYDYSGDLVVTVAPATSRGGRGGGLHGGEAESVNYKEWIEMLVLDRCVLEFSSPKSSHL